MSISTYIISALSREDSYLTLKQLSRYKVFVSHITLLFWQVHGKNTYLLICIPPFVRLLGICYDSFLSRGARGTYKPTSASTYLPMYRTFLLIPYHLPTYLPQPLPICRKLLNLPMIEVHTFNTWENVYWDLYITSYNLKYLVWGLQVSFRYRCDTV